MAKAARTFNVEMLLRASVYVSVAAKNLDEALAAAKNIELDDVADFSGNELLDYNLQAIGISDPTSYDKIND